jgi:hypothetical protein
VQTPRGKENFHITGMPMSTEPYFVKAFGQVKKAAAMANRDLGVLDPKLAAAIIHGCDRPCGPSGAAIERARGIEGRPERPVQHPHQHAMADLP